MCDVSHTSGRLFDVMPRIPRRSRGQDRRWRGLVPAIASPLVILACAGTGAVHAQEETLVHTPTASPAAMRPGSSLDVVFRASISGAGKAPAELVVLREDGSEVTRLLDDGVAPDFELGDYSYAGIVKSDQFTVSGEGCESFSVAADESLPGVAASDSVRVCFIDDDIPIGIPPLEPPESLEEIVVQDSSTRERFRSDQVLVKFSPGVSFEEIRSIVSGAPGSIDGFLPLTGIFLIGVTADDVDGLRSFVDYFQSFQGDDQNVGEVEYATPNHQLYDDKIRTSVRRSPQGASSGDRAFAAAAVALPNDLRFNQQRHYLNPIGAPQAWNRLRQTPLPLHPADMAILDTGLRGARGRDFNGRQRHQRDCIDQDDTALDESTEGHGTQVASVAAAKWNNAHKIAGMAMNRQFVSVRIKRGSPGPAPARPDGFVLNVICGFEYALSLSAPGTAPRRPLPPIKVINASFGTFDDSINAGANGAAVPSLEDVVRLVIDRNIVVVASATNVAFANEPKDYLPSPASYNLRIGNGLIVVGGSTSRDGLLLRPVESRRGAGVDLAAPGDRIQAIDHRYGNPTSHGTSFSTALVTGAVSLLRSRFPSLGARAVERVIKGAAVVRPAVPGGRRLHIDRALRDAGRL